MASNLHRVSEQTLRSLVTLRDEQIRNVGTPVVFYRPAGGTEYNEFGDVKKPVTLKLKTQIVIRWGAFRAQFSELGSSNEQNTPIEAVAKMIDDIPKGSEVDLTYEGPDHQITRTFEVVGVEIQIDDQTISKVLKLVPKRQVN